MCSGGLGKTDTGSTNVIGGLALEVFERNGRRYGSSKPEYNFEPHVAEDVFLSMLSEAGVDVFYQVIATSVSMGKGGTVSTINNASGTTFSAKAFADATYEGDLFAMAGASFAVGRESSATYGESFNGRYKYSPDNQIQTRVNPFAENGDPLPLVITGDVSPPGTGDKLVQAYNFRLCVTQNTSNFQPFPKPDSYDPEEWELFRRYAVVLAQEKGGVQLRDFLGNTRQAIGSKFDMNNGGPLSTDCIGCSWAWPEAPWGQRAAIWSRHKQYHLSLMEFLRTDKSIPAAVRAEAASWGLCADEFTDTGYWPEQLYVREGRRLVGDRVFTQNTAQKDHEQPDGIGCGSYNFDSHHSQRLVCAPDTKNCEPPSAQPPAGTNLTGWYFVDEGDVEINPGEYQIPFWVLLPKRAELTNVIVPISVSSSHIGYCTLRLEPQYMIMGHAAGAAAALAVSGGVAVQDVPVARLQSILRSQHAILDLPSTPRLRGA